MFSQWLLFICSFICVCGTGDESSTGVEQADQYRDTSASILAHSHYGWQVSGSVVSPHDVSAN